MHDFHKLAQRANNEYKHQHGLINVHVEGDPPVGLRYRFKEIRSANRFHLLRNLLHRAEGWSNSLRVEGCDVVEVWGEA